MGDAWLGKAGVVSAAVGMCLPFVALVTDFLLPAHVLGMLQWQWPGAIALTWLISMLFGLALAGPRKGLRTAWVPVSVIIAAILALLFIYCSRGADADRRDQRVV